MNTLPHAPSASADDSRAPAPWPPATVAERERLRQAAMQRAHELRREAISEFWRGTDQWFAEAVGHTRRAADRLAARLRQHAKQRGSAAGHERAIEA